MNAETSQRVRPASVFQGKVILPGDKSISHRALIFGALAHGRTEITHLLESGDVHSTRGCLEALGVEIRREGDQTIVFGRGEQGLRKPTATLDCGNSGTTIRLLMGVLAGQGFDTTLTGDDSLKRRPMKRVAAPLRKMGARIELAGENFAPITVHGQQLHGVSHELEVASAQVKTALLLAGLSAEGITQVRGEIGSRDHTERLLPYFGAKLDWRGEAISIAGGQRLEGARVEVPGDPSSAAFWMAGAALVRGGEVEISRMSLNPTRIGFLKVLERMGARIEKSLTQAEPEPIGNIRVCFSELRGTKVAPQEVPSLIDEIPVLAVLATQAEGRTEIRGAGELRVKESDRIEAVARNLRAMGVRLETFEDGLAIEGPQQLQGAEIHSYGDHRIAMAFAIAALVARGETVIRGVECVAISYPSFFEVLRGLTGEVVCP
jgi:3-phosphoshikimate 1-carboxyvinyltransferase